MAWERKSVQVISNSNPSACRATCTPPLDLRLGKSPRAQSTRPWVLMIWHRPRARLQRNTTSCAYPISTRIKCRQKAAESWRVAVSALAGCGA